MRKTTVGSVLLALVLAWSSAALALNPQPEPPKPYHGYEIVIVQTSANQWQWGIRKPSVGLPRDVLEFGMILGGRSQAMTAARTAIDAYGASSPLSSNHPTINLGPSFQRVSPAFQSLHPTYELFCWVGFFHTVLYFDNRGIGPVPPGTKIHWEVSAAPSAHAEGDYTFTEALNPSSDTVDLGYILEGQTVTGWPTCNFQIR